MIVLFLDRFNISGSRLPNLRIIKILIIHPEFNYAG